MTAEIVRGPWTGAPVVQTATAEPEVWWRRGDDGRLFVRPRGFGSWFVAPVPERPRSKRVWAQGTAAPLQLMEHADPRRITFALDLHGLYGDEVDEALGVLTDAADVVDRWETGDLHPSDSELARLAFLTGYEVWWFRQPFTLESSPGWSCGDDGCVSLPMEAE